MRERMADHLWSCFNSVAKFTNHCEELQTALVHLKYPGNLTAHSLSRPPLAHHVPGGKDLSTVLDRSINICSLGCPLLAAEGARCEAVNVYHALLDHVADFLVQTMYAGVIRDEVRTAAKKSEREAREKEFQEQIRRRLYLEQHQKVSDASPASQIPSDVSLTPMDEVEFQGCKTCR